ncbi:MAG: hypothetical protein LBV26_08575 [Bacteroidales bacterium]|jgi:hypothetical protein|nr:hypothetical protein [Bacteroidales bacterium]
MKPGNEIWLTERTDDGKPDKQILLFPEENIGTDKELQECRELKLDPPPAKFNRKNLLKKEPADITDSQFEYLCAGYVENDLSDEQIAELEEAVASDAARRNELELFKHIKLSAPDIRFNGKRKLLRTSTFRKTLSISVAALTAAASIAIFIILPHFAVNNNLPYNRLPKLSAETENIMAPEVLPKEVDAEILSAEPVVVAHISEETAVIEKEEPAVSDSSLTALRGNLPEPVKIPGLSSINIVAETASGANILLPPKDVYIVSTQKSQFQAINLARIFRKKILNEETPDTSPIKTYELAEAGINGLNKLLGWKMDFKKISDESGNIKTVRFSSKLLTVQTSVANRDR